MATVSKRKWTYKGVEKEAWVVRYTDQGGKERLKTVKGGKKEADRLRLKIETEIERGEHVPDRETATVGEAVRAWLEDCDRRHRIGAGIAGSTLKGYQTYAAEHVLPEFAEVKLTQLTGVAVQDFINRKANKHARSSCSHMRMVLSQSLRFAVRRKWVLRNPMVDDPVEIPAAAVTKQVVPPTRDDIAKLLRSLAKRRPYEHELPRHNRIAVVMLAVFAGMRRGEIVGLQWENVDFDQGLIRVEHAYTRQDGLKGPKTRSGRRKITMAACVLAALKALADFYGADQLTGYVLKNRGGGALHLDHLSGYEWHAMMKAADLLNADGSVKYTMHTMRHAYVSMLIEEGLDPFLIKNVVGHSKIATTLDIYGHLFPENAEARRAVRAIGSHFEAPIAILAARDRPRTKDQWAEARAAAAGLLADGMQIVDVAKQLSVSFSTVWNWKTENDKTTLTRQGSDKELQLIEIP